VLDVDKNFGQLMEGLKDVRPGVNVIVVSDHGMRPCSTSLDISGDADLSGFRVENDLTQILLYSSDKALVDRTYEVLKKNTKYRVYKRADTPKHLHYSQNERIGDLVVLPAATDAVGATTKDDESRWQRPMKGCHGYDPTDVAMHGTFYAAGPQIRNGVRLGPVENVEIYPLLVKLLGIKPPQKVDGTGVTARQLTY
jgi:predicted AlkP superfamily pyrophosphatase or phosphodiesterase